ncbi:MAG: hypothetical protein RBR08_11915 [Desulforegulaceae bacterium]|nr:hypothetical protein [Desulforegulaceae bacterium]
MDMFRNIKKKITIDFLVKKIELSLNSENGYSKIDHESLKIFLKTCGYESVSKRGLELFVKNETLPKVIVNDALIGLYETDVDDVVLRKAPTLKEMISFKNAKKILSDSDVLKSVKKDTLDYLRTSYIKNLDFSDIDKDLLLKEEKILFDADDFKGFFELALVFFELGSLKYIPFLSKKYNLYIFGEKFEKGNDSFFQNIGLLDKNNNAFLFTKNQISEKKFKDILSGEAEKKVFLKGYDAISEMGKMIEDLGKYLPFESNLFFYGLPENFNF